jgi:hypothetical protein
MSIFGTQEYLCVADESVASLPTKDALIELTFLQGRTLSQSILQRGAGFLFRMRTQAGGYKRHTRIEEASKYQLQTVHVFAKELCKE